MMPWKLYADAAAYIFTWLVGYSSLMGAIGGILHRRLLVVRGRELSLPDLFDPKGRLRLLTTPASTCRAMVALVLAIVPVVPGFVRAGTDAGRSGADPGLWDALYTYAWFVDVRSRASCSSPRASASSMLA